MYRILFSHLNVTFHYLTNCAIIQHCTGKVKSHNHVTLYIIYLLVCTLLKYLFEFLGNEPISFNLTIFGFWVGQHLCSVAEKLSEEKISLLHKHPAQSWVFSRHLPQHLLQQVFLFTLFNLLFAGKKPSKVKFNLYSIYSIMCLIHNSVTRALECIILYSDIALHHIMFLALYNERDMLPLPNIHATI